MMTARGGASAPPEGPGTPGTGSSGGGAGPLGSPARRWLDPRHPHRRSGPLSRRRYLSAVTAGVLLAAALLAAMATAIVAARAQADEALEQRFATRVQSSAQFVGTYLRQLASRLTLAARADLRPDDSPTTLRLLAEGFGFAQIEIRVGSRVAAAFPHPFPPPVETVTHRPVRLGAVAWSAGRDQVLLELGEAPAAGTGSLTTVAATFSVSTSPIEDVLRSVAVLRDHHVYLVAGGGAVVGSSPSSGAGTLQAASRRLAGAVAGPPQASSELTSYLANGRVQAVAIAAVPSTPWRLVVTEPSAELLASEGGLGAVTPWIVFGLVALTTSALLWLFVRSLAARRQLQESWDGLREEANTDPLTGLANRRRLESVIQLLQDSGTPHAIVMIDLDHFKEVNDRFGHNAGDEALRRVAALMRAAFRERDLLGRWGGDEFLAVVPGGGAFEVASLAARLQRAVERANESDLGGLPPISLSIGSAASAPGMDALEEADRSLYRAKGTRPPARTGPSRQQRAGSNLDDR